MVNGNDYKRGIIPHMNLQQYERYLPSAFDNSLSILEKINKMIHQMNLIGNVTNDVVEKWEELMRWIEGQGLVDIVNKIIDDKIADGTFDTLFDNIIGDLDNLLTNDKTLIVNAINEVFSSNQLTQQQLDDFTLQIESLIGDVNNLTTNDKSNLVNAINEIKRIADINQLATITISEATGYGIISGFKVSQQPVLSMAVEVGVGTTNIIHMKDGVRYTKDGVVLPIDPSHATLNRMDVVYVTALGDIVVAKGVNATNPLPPVIPSDGVELAIVTVLAGDTTINDTDIEDIRQMKSLVNLKTSNKSNFVQAINEIIVTMETTINNVIGGVTNLDTDDKANLVNAINEVYEKLNDLKDKVGNLDTLNTTNKNNVVESLNELYTNVGILSNLQTNNKTDVVSAINELKASGGDSVGDINNLVTPKKDTVVSALNETYTSLIDRIKTLKQFDAVGDGNANDTNAVIDFELNDSLGLITNGSYNVSGTIPNPDKTRMILTTDDVTINNKRFPHLSISPQPFKSIPNNLVFIEQDTTKDNTETTLHVQRNVKTHDGYINPKALRVATTVLTDTTQTEWAISGELYNYSNVASEGNTAVSGVSRKYGKGQVFAGHFQVKDHYVFPTRDEVTPLTAVELNTCAIGKDHPTANYGMGNRFGMDIIAITTVDDNPNAEDAEIGVGLLIRTDDGSRSRGYYRYGIVLMDTINGNPNPIDTAYLDRTHGRVGIDFQGIHSLAHIKGTGQAQFGILLHGTYTSKVALRINEGDAISFEGTGNIRQYFDGVTSRMNFTNSGTKQIAFGLGGSPSILLNDTKVVGTRINGWLTPTGASSRSAFETSTVTTAQLASTVKALIEDLKTHGLIGE